MNYYKRHLGDYARDTGHLSALEHGIYTLLLDWYYTNECPISEAKAKRITRGNPDETQMVLEEFFTFTEKGWKHARADREIAEYQEKADRNRTSGKLGGRPKKTQTVSETKAIGTLATSHKPLAIKEQEQERPPTAAADVKADLFARWKAIPDGGGAAFLSALFRDNKPEQAVLEAVERTLDHSPADPKGFVKGILKKGAADDAAYELLMARAK